MNLHKYAVRTPAKMLKRRIRPSLQNGRGPEQMKGLTVFDRLEQMIARPSDMLGRWDMDLDIRFPGR